MNYNCDKNGRPLKTVDPADIPNRNNPENIYMCTQLCTEETCKDIREGEYEFEGPKMVFGVCNLKKSYLIVKVDDDCEVRWNAVWMAGKTLVDTKGTYKIKYKWDNCCELEPVFGKEDYPCPCK